MLVENVVRRFAVPPVPAFTLLFRILARRAAAETLAPPDVSALSAAASILVMLEPALALGRIAFRQR